MMAASRTNEEWIKALNGEDQAQAILDLRDILLRACLFTLVSHPDDLSGMGEADRLALAEDCAQEALQTVLTHLGEFRGESKFTTWAYKFGINIALTRARRERWKSVSLDSLSDDDNAADWLQWKANLLTTDSEIPMLKREAGAVIIEALQTELTSLQRQVLKWMAFDGVPMDVVTERLETNRNAVYKLLHDGRLKMKRYLAVHGYQVEEIYDLFRMS